VADKVSCNDLVKDVNIVPTFDEPTRKGFVLFY
jgi:hypothetical protein